MCIFYSFDLLFEQKSQKPKLSLENENLNGGGGGGGYYYFIISL